MDPRQRRASDGLLCVVKETSSDMVSSRGHRSPVLSYKTEPGDGKYNFTLRLYLLKEKYGCIKFVNTCSQFFSFLDHSFTYVNQKNDYDTKEKCRVSRNGHNRYVSETSVHAQNENKVKFNH